MSVPPPRRSARTYASYVNDNMPITPYTGNRYYNAPLSMSTSRSFSSSSRSPSMMTMRSASPPPRYRTSSCGDDWGNPGDDDGMAGSFNARSIPTKADFSGYPSASMSSSPYSMRYASPPRRPTTSASMMVDPYGVSYDPYALRSARASSPSTRSRANTTAAGFPRPLFPISARSNY